MTATAWIFTAAGLGVLVGFLLGLEAGRQIHNRKMDEIRATVLDMRATLDAIRNRNIEEITRDPFRGKV